MKNISDNLTNNIKRHLIQPWPYASSIGDEYRDIVMNGEGIYIEDKNGNIVATGSGSLWNVGAYETRIFEASAGWEYEFENCIIEVAYTTDP